MSNLALGIATGVIAIVVAAWAIVPLAFGQWIRKQGK